MLELICTHQHWCDRFRVAHFATLNWNETMVPCAYAFIFELRSCDLIGDRSGGDGQEFLPIWRFQLLVIGQSEGVAFVFALRHVDAQIGAVCQVVTQFGGAGVGACAFVFQLEHTFIVETDHGLGVFLCVDGKPFDRRNQVQIDANEFGEEICSSSTGQFQLREQRKTEMKMER